MKKLLIIVGIILIIFIVVAMGYFLLFGTPKSAEEVFTNFGFGPTPEFTNTGSDNTDTATDTEVDQPVNRLTQLTLKAVAGAVVLDDTVRFVERGTGHIYEIDFMGKNEVLVSGTTIPKSARASFSPTGNQVAITSEIDGRYETTVGEISNDGLTGVTLPAGSREVYFAEEGLVSYIVDQAQGVTAYTYDVTTKKSARRFSVPMRDINVRWGDQTYLYTTPTNKQNGYLYAVKKVGLDYVTKEGPALMGIPYYGGILTTKIVDGVLETTATATSSDSFILPISVITTKCVANPVIIGRLYCGAEGALLNGATHPDDWYKGLVSMNDNIWEIDTTTQSVTVLSEPLLEVGRAIDVLDIGISANGHYAYLINKNDGSLWLLNLTTQ